MLAIQTKFLPPTTHKDSRVKAKMGTNQLTLPWDYSQSEEVNNRKAAFALLRKFASSYAQSLPLVTGHLPDGSYCHVLHDERK